MSRALLSLVFCALALAACGGSSPHASSRTAAARPLVHLPADQAAHLDSPNEWWYVVGHLRSGGQTFGYEVTTFRFSHVHVPGSPAGTPPVSLFRTDVAITDETGKRFHQKITYYFPQSGRVSAASLNVHVGNVSLVGRSPSDMTLRASLPSGKIALRLHSRRPPMYVGGRGYLHFANGFTYYYSLTDLQTSGTITTGSHTREVTGTSWLDHQWGTWTWTTVTGWTWMAIQLKNGAQFSLFDFRSTAGRVRGASILMPNGKLRTAKTVKIESTGSWLSPHTAGRYPSGWIVRIPTLHATLTVRPKVLDQELVDRAQARGSYWEGSGRVTGTFAGKPATGESYTELTGYARQRG